MRPAVWLLLVPALAGCPARDQSAGPPLPPAERRLPPVAGKRITITATVVGATPAPGDITDLFREKPLVRPAWTLVLVDDPRKPKAAQVEYVCALPPTDTHPHDVAPPGSRVNVTGIVGQVTGNLVTLGNCEWPPAK